MGEAKIQARLLVFTYPWLRSAASTFVLVIVIVSSSSFAFPTGKLTTITITGT
jgi:hypothetical protein